MSMDKVTLENLITKGIQDAYSQLFPDVIVNVEVAQIPKEDGSSDFKITETRGPLKPDENAIRALARGIAHGIVEHLREHAVVTVNNIAAGLTSVDAEIT